MHNERSNTRPPSSGVAVPGLDRLLAQDITRDARCATHRLGEARCDQTAVDETATNTDQKGCSMPQISVQAHTADGTLGAVTVAERTVSTQLQNDDYLAQRQSHSEHARERRGYAPSPTDNGPTGTYDRGTGVGSGSVIDDQKVTPLEGVAERVALQSSPGTGNGPPRPHHSGLLVRAALSVRQGCVGSSKAAELGARGSCRRRSAGSGGVKAR